ncbi:MAG: sulfite exporter TauE/SafE family protein [Methylococcales bacterium]|nr:sulfite exporter TauE/SafE family protein [Methylococcales bacterium]
MQCTGCEQTIEDAILLLPGIVKVNANYVKNNLAIVFDNNVIGENEFRLALEKKGYETQTEKTKNKSNLLRSIIFIILLLIVGSVAFWGKSLMPELIPQLNAEMSHFMLFSIGFLTGFHCIGMCGSFVVSYSHETMTRTKTFLSHFAYGLGKTISYSAIGAGFGLLGAAMTITSHMQGLAALFASVFLLIYGLKMLDFIPSLRFFTLRLPKTFTRDVKDNIKTQRSPLIIGLLTGFLLGCGPLQAMYIMAAGTGSPEEGAKLLFFFGIGTLIPLLGFGFFANLMSRSTINDLVRVSGILVIVMGVMMANRGLKLTKSGYDFSSVKGRVEQTINSVDLNSREKG